MKSAILGIMLLLALTAPTHAMFQDYDGGPILSVGDDHIVIQGENGRYVVEPLGVCSWCQVGIHVTLRFQGFIRGALRPKDDWGAVRPLQVLILEDARNE